MEIKVLGTGCVRCNTTEQIVREAVARTGIEAKVVKVSDRMEIAKTGVRLTPAVMIGQEIKFMGQVPEIDDVINCLKQLVKG
ncbi:MAG: TM0996/MTH895 family glutaredoxin-like protein [Deltaproteobacteria bacterium]|nr:TM0996/MTH895 family glutaredoxin-like protein [Deltaproteobacteria bacterium]